MELGDNLVGEFDQSRVREAFSNLLSNAVQYSAPGTLVRVVVTDLGERVRLEVRNRGEPIPAAAMHSIFEPLRRADEKRRTGTPHNLGIGLFIVREVARAHGGSVGVENGEGEVVFRMELCKKA